jgi:hypothetical protein
MEDKKIHRQINAWATRILPKPWVKVSVPDVRPVPAPEVIFVYLFLFVISPIRVQFLFIYRIQSSWR